MCSRGSCSQEQCNEGGLPAGNGIRQHFRNTYRLGGPHPVIATIEHNKDYIRVLSIISPLPGGGST